MSTEPSMRRPQRARFGPNAVTRVVTRSPRGPLVGPFLIALLGVLLGITNLAAEGTAMALRTPALLASLLMVGQGMHEIRRHWPRKVERIAVPDTEERIVDMTTGQARVRELATVQELPAAPITAAAQANASTMAVPILVMLLAAWLGLADLRVVAPVDLKVLSLVASFLLFALGWSLLPTRH
jgi:hypothetical protein